MYLHAYGCIVVWYCCCRTDVTDNYTIECTFDSDVDCCFRVVYCMKDDVNLCELTNV